MFNFCNACGCALSSQAAFCPNCGNPCLLAASEPSIFVRNRSWMRVRPMVTILVAALLSLTGYLGWRSWVADAVVQSKRDGALRTSTEAFSKEFAAVFRPLKIEVEKARVAKSQAEAGNPAAMAELAALGVDAAKMMQAAEAAALNPDEKLVAGQLAVNLGGFIGDVPMRQRGAKLMLASGKLDPSKVTEFQFYLGNFAYANKDYATASTALAAAVAANYAAPEAGELMVDSYARAGQPSRGLALLKLAVAAKRAAGQPVPEGWLKRANVVAYNANLGAEAIDRALSQVELYPSNFNWLGSAQLVRRFANYGPNETIDLFRLMIRSGALDNDPKLVGNEYREYIQTADPRRLPGEVIKVIDKGTEAGALSGAFVTESRALAAGLVAPDKASLPSLEAQAATSFSGLEALSTGDGYLNYGNAAKAEALYKMALGKRGVDKDRVLTRLGIAQFDQGNYADARASFRQVVGVRVPIARLWLTLISTNTNQR